MTYILILVASVIFLCILADKLSDRRRRIAKCKIYCVCKREKLFLGKRAYRSV